MVTFYREWQTGPDLSVHLYWHQLPQSRKAREWLEDIFVHRLQRSWEEISGSVSEEGTDIGV